MFRSNIRDSISEGETLYRGSTINLAHHDIETDEEGYDDEQVETIAIPCLAEIEGNGTPEERPYALLGSPKGQESVCQ
ncbi:unnamed protein product [Ambrosiozyma monospora]|uniref:Unnamed protein product n=1 Tax=Ambrosiozyma monospora TaxID=43982 RepID=A0A9W6YXG6_AMBMO|nr:unnamed protein product [Ambrosiozyma monospora]